MRVCVYGASSDSIDQIYFREAKLLGRLMAESGIELVFGGGQSGLMGACAEGLHQAGGHVTGIIPEFFNEPGVLYPHCDQVIITEDMSSRKKLMDEMSDGFIALPGGLGSYDELFESLTLRQIGRHSKPIAILNTNDYYAPLYALLSHTASTGFMNESAMESFCLCATPAEAVEHMLKG